VRNYRTGFGKPRQVRYWTSNAPALAPVLSQNTNEPIKRPRGSSNLGFPPPPQRLDLNSTRTLDQPALILGGGGPTYATAVSRDSLRFSGYCQDRLVKFGNMVIWSS
jgi:hypothetical protein